MLDIEMICNIAAYKFVHLEFQFLTELKKELLSKTKNLIIKGTILLSAEGINLFLAGEEKDIKFFQTLLQNYAEFNDLPYKYSYSKKLPFKKFLIKIRKDIIACDDNTIKPDQETAPYISPQALKQWFDEQHEMLILDTRNKFEFDMGHFSQAIHLDLDNFRQFTDAIKLLPENHKNKAVITYCTGGIRCEKAALILSKHGFKQVFQLEGGILNFFEHCGGAYYEGNCFVFDDRLALDPDLKPVQD